MSGLAEALADLVRTRADRPGRLLGLSGAQGSGNAPLGGKLAPLVGAGGLPGGQSGPPGCYGEQEAFCRGLERQAGWEETHPIHLRLDLLQGGHRIAHDQAGFTGGLVGAGQVARQVGFAAAGPALDHYRVSPASYP